MPSINCSFLSRSFVNPIIQAADSPSHFSVVWGYGFRAVLGKLRAIMGKWLRESALAVVGARSAQPSLCSLSAELRS